MPSHLDAASVPERVVARAGTPGLAPLWAELARRLGASGRPVRRVRLTGLTPPQREAVADLLGAATLPGATTVVTVEQVRTALRLSEPQLRVLVAELAGPIDDRAARRVADHAARTGLWDEVAAAVADRGVDAWVARLRAAGVPDGDVAGHRARLRPLLGLVGSLPLAAPRPLAIVAQHHLGDPHGLDADTWAGVVVAGVAAALTGRTTPFSAQDTRAALAAVGVVADALSAPVLTLGLRGSGGAPGADRAPSAGAARWPASGASSCSAWLTSFAEAGEPVTLTASQLRRWPLAAGEFPLVSVVENPSVVAAAAVAGVTAPLVCTASWPTQAGVLLLDQLRAAGVALRYHGDVDPTGLVLAEHHRRRFGARPWRLGQADYLAAVDQATVAIGPEVAIPPTPWDPGLADAVGRHRRVVFEEQVVDLLLTDLRR